jgi:hypothetical protein
MPTIDERELENFLMEPGNLQHIEIPEGGEERKYRQLNLGDYGIADIVVITPEVRPLDGIDYLIHVIELKKDEIGPSTITQASRYVAGIKHYLGQIMGHKLRIEYQISIVGRSLQDGDWWFLNGFLNNISIWTYDLDLETGISFLQHDLYGIAFPKANPPTAFVDLFKKTIEPRREEIVAGYINYLKESPKALPAPQAANG